MKDQITYIKNKIAEIGLEITDRQAEQFSNIMNCCGVESVYESYRYYGV